jgi:hypothetical protein
MGDQQIAAELNVEFRKYIQGMTAAQRAAVRVDGALAALVGTANKAERALNALRGNVTVDLQVDTSQVDQAESDIRALDGATPKVTVTTDAGSLDKAASDVRMLDGATPDVTVTADTSQIDRAESDVRAIDGQTPEVSVKVDASDLDALKSDLRAVKNLATIDLVLNLAQGGIAGAAAIKELPIIGSVQDMQEASNILAARGQESAAALQAVNAAYANNFGSSRAELATLAAQILGVTGNTETLGADIEAVLGIAAAQGQDANGVFTAMTNLVSSGLSPDFASAADVLTTGFQNGADRAEDFLDTIREYSGQFATMGADAGQFISFLTTGLDAGALNADKLADTLKEAGIKLTEAVADPESIPAQALTRVLGADEAGLLLEAARVGDITGQEYFAAVQKALASGQGTDFDLFEIFGTPAEDATVQAILGATFDSIEVEAGSAAEATSAIFDTLGGDLTSLARTFEVEFLASLGAVTGGLDEWISGAREKIQTLGAELRSGTGLPEALEIALQAPGLSDRIRDFEGAIGGFIIELQLALASVAEFFGNAEAGTALRQSAAGAAAEQLTYDLVFASDPEQITTAVMDAIRRGVTDKALSTSVAAAVAESIEGGAVAQAQAIVDAVSGVTLTSTTTTGLGFGPLNLDLATATDIQTVDTSGAQTILDGALQTMLDQATAGITIDEAISGVLTTFTGAASEIITEAADVKAGLTPITEGFTAVRNEATLTGSDVGVAMDIAATATEDSMARMLAAHDATFPPALAWWEEWKQTAFDAIQASGGIIPNVATVPPRAMGSGFDGYASGGVMSPGQAIVGERGRELVSTNTALAVLNNRTTEAILSGLAGLNMGAGMGGGGNVYNVSMNLYTSGNAQAAGAAGQFSRQLRGYAS